MEARPPSPKSTAAVIKRTAKKTARRKTASKKGRSAAPPSPTPREIESVYQDYLQTAKEVRRGSLRVFLPYLVIGIVIAITCIISSFFTWGEKLGIDRLERAPTPFTWVLIWGGILICLGLIVLGAFTGDQWGHVQAREIAKDRVGFPEFYRAFLKRFWPKEGMVTGSAYEKFLKFIGEQ
jgi:hypothetical protein